jgi:hypothetical protein
MLEEADIRPSKKNSAMLGRHFASLLQGMEESLRERAWAPNGLASFYFDSLRTSIIRAAASTVISK